MALAQTRDLTFAYGAGPPVLDGISLEFADGEHVALLGPSGSGKSTLLRAFAGLVPHFHGGVFSGSVVVGGFDTRETQPAQLVGTVASVFQDPEDQLVMSRVANEVAFGLENLGVEPDEIWPRVSEALELVGAEHLAERPVGELSGGELQRVCLASALALRPRLLLLDEPTSQLDPEAADAFFDLVEEFPEFAYLAHPSFGGARSIAPELLFGRLLRLFGSDAVIFVNVGGRFGYTHETCARLAHGARAPWGAIRPALPVPAGGMRLERIEELLDFYGPDSMLLIGGNLLIDRDRVLERTRAFVDRVAAHRFSRPSLQR